MKQCEPQRCFLVFIGGFPSFLLLDLTCFA
jgi:hypothetical protein